MPDQSTGLWSLEPSSACCSIPLHSDNGSCSRNSLGWGHASCLSSSSPNGSVPPRRWVLSHTMSPFDTSG